MLPPMLIRGVGDALFAGWPRGAVGATPGGSPEIEGHRRLLLATVNFR